VSHQAGIATTVAVFLHEVPHHIADVGVLIYSGMGRRKATLLNLLATSGCAIGGVLVLISGMKSAAFTFTVLPIAAANFLYIGLAILIPELQRENNNRRAFVQLAGFVSAALLMTTLSYWRPE
jgi:zinc and cadmium transporter